LTQALEEAAAGFLRLHQQLLYRPCAEQIEPPAVGDRPAAVKQHGPRSMANSREILGGVGAVRQRVHGTGQHSQKIGHRCEGGDCNPLQSGVLGASRRGFGSKMKQACRIGETIAVKPPRLTAGFDVVWALQDLTVQRNSLGKTAYLSFLTVSSGCIRRSNFDQVLTDLAARYVCSCLLSTALHRTAMGQVWLKWTCREHSTWHFRKKN